jgi:NitT/TauT family transport system substrate-binding protein
MKRQVMRVALAVSVAFALAACGGGSDDKPAKDGEMRAVSIGMLPITPTGAMQVGIDQGFFKKRGIDLKIETAQGGAALIPGVMSGKPQFASSNPVSLLTARDKGLDLKVISHWSSEPEEGDGINGVVALKDSGITSAKDLAGKSVAVNTLKSMGEVTIREAVRKDGGDADKVKFVELGFPDMPAALEAGNVDAVWVPEPFMSGLVKKGEHLVGYTSKDSVPGLPTQFIFTSAQMMKSDPKLVADMTAALEETLTYADENPDQVRDAAAKLTKMDRGLLDTIKIDSFGTDLRLAQVNKLGELMQQDGLIEKPADVKGLMP